MMGSYIATQVLEACPDLQVYTVEKVHTLLRQLCTEASTMLLFLKTVAQVQAQLQCCDSF